MIRLDSIPHLTTQNLLLTQFSNIFFKKLRLGFVRCVICQYPFSLFLRNSLRIYRCYFPSSRDTTSYCNPLSLYVSHHFKDLCNLQRQHSQKILIIILRFYYSGILSENHWCWHINRKYSLTLGRFCVSKDYL